MRTFLPMNLIALSVLSTSAVYADTESPSLESNNSSPVVSSELPNIPDLQNGHFYLGGRAGWSNYHHACDRDALDCANDTFGYGLYLGYQFNSWLALEGGINDYGSPEARYVNGTSEANFIGSEVLVKLSHPLSEHLELFSRLGGAYQSIDKQYDGFGVDDKSDHAWTGVVTAGLEYRLSQRWSVRGEYQFSSALDEGETDLNFTSLGLTYHFGQVSPVLVEAPLAEPELVEPIVEAVPVAQAERYVTADAPIIIHYSFDSQELTESEHLEPLVKQLHTYPEDQVRIDGYTDSSGPALYNQTLSEQRAQSVANYIEAQGIESSRLTVFGHGERDPKVDNASPEHRAQNRRVEVHLETTAP